MIGLLADHNAEGHLARLVAVLVGSEWSAAWAELGLSTETFASVGLSRLASDRVVWVLCQSRRLVLLTANRNHDEPDSLEAAIRDGVPDDLPVLTLSDAGRVFRDAGYASQVAVDLLELLQDVVQRPQSILGSGRRYLPISRA